MTRTIGPGSAEWPIRLQELGPHRPPERLHAEGLAVPCGPAIAVVGTRRPTGAGMEAAYRMAYGLAEAGWVVISGLAVGIDAAAHRAALDARGRTVAVLGCGLDVRYPVANARLRARVAESGTVLSEYPPGTPPAKSHFPWRNRIIAGLSLGVVVVEGNIRSGALVTARLALDMNRAVYAVPGSCRNPMAEGPNELIRRSEAALVTEVDHIFEDLAPSLAWTGGSGLDTSAEPKLSCGPSQLRVLTALDDVPLPAEHLLDHAGMRAAEIAMVLSQLEVRGLVSRSAGGYALTAGGRRALT